MTVDERVEIAKEAKQLIDQLNTYELAVLFESLAIENYRAGTGRYVAFEEAADAMWKLNKMGLD